MLSRLLIITVFKFELCIERKYRFSFSRCLNNISLFEE